MTNKANEFDTKYLYDSIRTIVSTVQFFLAIASPKISQPYLLCGIQNINKYILLYTYMAGYQISP